MTRTSHKLTNRTTKTEYFEKYSKMRIVLNFKTIRYKLTALDNIIPLIGYIKFMRPVSILRLPKE